MAVSHLFVLKLTGHKRIMSDYVSMELKSVLREVSRHIIVLMFSGDVLRVLYFSMVIYNFYKSVCCLRV